MGTPLQCRCVVQEAALFSKRTQRALRLRGAAGGPEGAVKGAPQWAGTCYCL